METTLRTLEKIIPKKLYQFFQPTYHYLLATAGSYLYLFPSKKIHVVAITGTKGKSSTVEFVNAILEHAHKKTAILSTIRFKIGDSNQPNKYKMTMPGRFFTQKFLRDAVHHHCDYAIIEMTSEGARFYRHKGVALDTLIFTNLSPEHIESHGSFTNYLNAKLRLAVAVAKSTKETRRVIANTGNPYGAHFLIYNTTENIPYNLSQIKIKSKSHTHSVITYKDIEITIPLPGEFNIENALAAITFAETQNIPLTIIKEGIESLQYIRGRVERVSLGQPFDVIVDYAHTDESLRKLYETFAGKKKVCVLGSTGGGRDSWKRPVMGKIADTYCDEIILTDEDPYDEDPENIIKEVASGITNHTPHIILDRREAIEKAVSLAKSGDVVLITGKGTDPYIMGRHGTKIPWDDATVARESLAKQLANSK